MPDRKISVLVVEDQFTLRLGMCGYLMDMEYEVFSSENGEEALKFLKDHAPDIGIVDIRLPGMSGDDFILAAHEIRPRMRFLILTGSVHFRLPDQLEALGLRKEHVFYKPMDDLDLLVDAIGDALDRNRE